MKDQLLEQAALNVLQECLERIPFLQIDRIESPGADIQVQVRVQGQPRLLLAQVKALLRTLRARRSDRARL